MSDYHATTGSNRFAVTDHEMFGNIANCTNTSEGSLSYCDDGEKVWINSDGYIVSFDEENADFLPGDAKHFLENEFEIADFGRLIQPYVQAGDAAVLRESGSWDDGCNGSDCAVIITRQEIRKVLFESMLEKEVREMTGNEFWFHD